MNYSDYGLDEKKVSQDPDSKVREWCCLWVHDTDRLAGHRVMNGFNLCFANFVICRDCVETADQPEHAARWIVADCFKCSTKEVPVYSSKDDKPEDGIALCGDCLAWAKETFTKQDEFINKERAQMTTEEILLKCIVHGNNIKLPDDLVLDYKSEYAPVKKKIEKAGGRWIGRDVSAFVFKSDPTDILAALQAGESPKLINEESAKTPLNPSDQHRTELASDSNQARIEQLKALPIIEPHPSPATLDLTNQTLGQAINSLLQPSEKLTPTQTDMSFFTQLAALLGQAEISLTVKAKDENLTVMLMPKGATQLDKVKPLILSGSAADLDQEFFATVSGSIQKMSGIVSNVADFDKSLTKAEAAPAGDAKTGKSRSRKKDELVTETVGAEAQASPPEAEVLKTQDAPDQEEVNQEELDRIAAEEAAAAEAKAKEERSAKYEAALSLANSHFGFRNFEAAKKHFIEAQEFTDEPAILDADIAKCTDEIERGEKYLALTAKSSEFASNEDWKNAAGALKQARTLAPNPESLDGQIKEYMQKAIEAEMASESYL